MMENRHLKALLYSKKIAAYGSRLGLILLLIGFFVNGTNSYYFTGLGFGIVLGSFFTFLCGTFLSIMAEYSIHNKNKAKIAVVSSRNFYTNNRNKMGKRPALTLIEGTHQHNPKPEYKASGK